MASVRQISLRLGALVVALAGCLSAGCVGVNLQISQESAREQELPCELAACWQHEVAFAPDPAHGGQPAPGLVGRVFLFNKKRLPVEGDGSLHVELADGSVTPAKVLEQWNFDPVTLRKYQRKDMVGPGYSVFLPWGTYSPDRTHVVMRVVYKPAKGTPLYATPSSLALDGGSKNPMTAR
jgi:hypothetical protein